MFIIIFLLSSQLATKHCNIVPISPLSLTEHSVFLVVNHDRMLSLLFTSLLVIFHEFILCVFFLLLVFFSFSILLVLFSILGYYYSSHRSKSYPAAAGECNAMWHWNAADNNNNVPAADAKNDDDVLGS